MSIPAPSLEAWKLRALATSMSDGLQQQYGKRKYYTAEEVEDICDQYNVPLKVREYAVAMFVEPSETRGFLERLGSSKTAGELRKFMAQVIFFYYAPDASFHSDAIDFHEAGHAGGPASGSFDSGDCGSDGGGGGDCGGDGGGD